MNSEFLSNFKKIIRNANYDNTYKMAWAKALVELSNNFYHNEENLITISFSDIALKFIKYYWNQTIFFDLVQGSNLKKKPIIVQYIKYLIEIYYETQNSRKPEFFEKVEATNKSRVFESELIKIINKTINMLKENVSWRFPFLSNENQLDIYIYNKRENYLLIKKSNILDLYDNQQDLYDLINYRWSLILETFNSSPRINKKVRIIDEREINRKPLNKFKKILDLENSEHICFICGQKIFENALSIDHIIPWSYLYSDDIWNLVYVHQSCNSRKSNFIPTEKDILRLQERNNNLMNEVLCQNYSGKLVDELKLSIEKDYVKKFWIGCRQ